MTDKQTNLTNDIVPEVSTLLEMLANVPKVSPASKQVKDKELEYIKPTVDLIKDIRTAYGASQPEIAWEMGMIQQNVSRIDTNIINPRLSTVKRYLEACGVNLDELLANALSKMEDDIKLDINSHRYSQKELHSLYVWRDNKSLGCSRKEFESAMLGVLDIRVKLDKVIKEDDGTTTLRFYIHNDDVHKLENSGFDRCIVKYENDTKNKLASSY